MKRFYILISFLSITMLSKAQSVQSIHFNLYTDSLKKGTHNYINVDGKMSDGSWKPLTAKDIEFRANYGHFEGNDLILPENPIVRNIIVKASLKTDPTKSVQTTIWIKQLPDPPLPAETNIGTRKNKR